MGLGGRTGDRLLTVLTVGVTVVAVVAVVHRFISGPPLPAIPTEFEPRVISDWNDYASDGVRLGPGSAAVVIVAFFDYLCPRCEAADAQLRELRRRHPEKVAVVYRHFPFLADLSFSASVAAECGRRAGRFRPIHEALLTGTDSLGITPWTRIAIGAGVRDTATFRACMHGRAAEQVVRRDLRAGQRLGVAGTPTLLVNELLFEGSPGLAYLDATVRRASTRRP